MINNIASDIWHKAFGKFQESLIDSFIASGTVSKKQISAIDRWIRYLQRKRLLINTTKD